MSGLRPNRPASTPRLTPAALAFRVVHGAVATGFLLAIAYVWWCAVSGRRGPWLRVAVAALTTEGALVAANGGDCPLGGLQGRAGDPIPLFELVLSPRAARRAVPVLGGVAAVGIALVVARGRRGLVVRTDGGRVRAAGQARGCRVRSARFHRWPQTRPNLGSFTMLTPKVICLSSLPSAHGSRMQSGAVSAALSAAKR